MRNKKKRIMIVRAREREGGEGRRKKKKDKMYRTKQRLYDNFHGASRETSIVM